MKAWSEDYRRVEAIIDERLAKELEDWEYEFEDVANLRKETYKANGYEGDPFEETWDEGTEWEREAQEEEEDEEEETYTYRSMHDQLADLGMTEWDFF